MSKLSKNFFELYSALKPLLAENFKSDEAIILGAIEHVQSRNGYTTVTNLEEELADTFTRTTLYRKLLKLKNRKIISYHSKPDDERVRIVKIKI